VHDSALLHTCDTRSLLVDVNVADMPLIPKYWTASHCLQSAADTNVYITGRALMSTDFRSVAAWRNRWFL